MTRDFSAEQRMRIAYVELMVSLGFTLVEMADCSDYKYHTIRADITDQGLTEKYPNRPGKDERFAVVLLYYANLITGNEIGETLPGTRSILEKWLRISEVTAFINGVKVHEKLMANPLLADEDLPYLELLKAVFGVTYPDPMESLNDRRAGDYIDKFMSELVDGRRQPPKSFSDFMVDVLHFVEAPTDAWVVGPFWTVSATTLIDRVLKTLTMQEQHVLRLYYGLTGDKPLNFRQISIKMNVVMGRIQQVHTKAMEELRHPSRVEKLRGFVELLDGDKLAEHEDQVRKLKGIIGAQAATITTLSEELKSVSVVSVDAQGPERLISDELLLPALSESVDELNLTVRSRNCLNNASLERVHQLVILNEEELLRFKNLGRKSLNDIKDSLAVYGSEFGVCLTLGMRLNPGLLRQTEKACD